MDEALRDLYPEYSWDPSKFPRRKGLWTDLGNIVQFITRAEQQLGIQQVYLTSYSSISRSLSLRSSLLNLSIYLSLSLTSLLTPFTQPSDWYSITLADLKNIGASTKISKSDLAEALHKIYPDFKWEKILLLKGRYGQQRRLEHVVAKLFPVFFHFTKGFESNKTA